MATTLTFRPRATRDQLRGRLAAATVRATGGSAMTQAFAAIDAEFNEAGKVNSFKRRVEASIRKSFGHPEVQARYRYYIEWIARENMGLDEACGAMAEEFCAHLRGPALAGMIRAEMLLILRWMRAKGMHAEFAETVAAMRAPVRHLEAAE